MSDIRLDKPATGKVQNIPCGENARFILGFPTSEAVVVRDGESLVMNFTEGGQLRFDDFYKNYGKGRLPSFVVDDTEINAKEFFTAMGEPELVPAAGPAGQASQTPSVADGARFHDWSGMETMTGLTHLSGLDLTLEASPYAFAERHVDPFETRETPASAAPAPAPEPEPSPVVPPRNPGILIPRVHDGENSFASHDIASHGAAIVVDEGILAGGKHTLHGASGTRNFLIDLYGETNGTVEISDGSHTISLDLSEGIGTEAPASSSFMVSGVKIDILGATALGNGKFAIAFSYQLIDAIDHGDEDFVVNDGLLVKVTNATGLVSEDRLNVEVHDDIPEVLAPSFTGAVTDKDGIWVSDDKESISGKFEGLRIGADHEGAVVEIEVVYDGDSEKATFEVRNGSLERTGGERGLFIDEEGNFSWTRPSSHIGKGTDEYSFRAMITDADGDTAEASATVTTNSTPFFGVPGGSGDDSSLVILTKESLLPNGTEGKGENPVYEGTININTHGEGGILSIANGMAKITLDATDSADTGAAIKTAFGTFTVTEIKDGVLSWRYELESALSSGKNASGIHESVEHIGIMLTDFTHADKSFLDISIDMADDTPRIEVTESGKTVFTGATASGTVPFTYGADNGDAALVKISFGEESVSAHDGKLVLAGESGTLTVDLDAGTWSYEAKPLKIGTDGQKTEGSGKAGTDAFRFEIRDADGDTKEANLEIEVKEPLAPVALEEIVVYENGLNGGEGVTSGQVLLPGGYEFTVAKAPESGNFDPESKSYAITEAVTLEGESKDDSFVVTVRDADGNAYDLVQKVTIVDDEPQIFASTYEQALESPKFESSFDFSGHDTVTAKPSDFTADGWSHIYYATPKANGGGLSTSSKSGTHAYWVTKDGLEIIPSYVAYKYDDAGNFTVDAISDVNFYVQDYVTTSNANNNAKANKHLAMGPNGLTVGTSGTSGNLNGLDQNGIAALNDNVSEALVFQYNTPTYGLNIRFGGLGEGEKAILCFMLTPKNSNDDSVVKIVEVTKDDLNDDGWLSTDVASGFTKLIVSSAPGESGGVSSFGVLNLGLKRNAQLYDGRIEFEAGADGLPEDGGITWDWSGSGLDNALVEIQSVLAGVYRVSLVHDGNTVKAMLTAIGSDKEYDGEELFTGTLDAVTGKWHIIQFLKFRTYDGDVLKDAVFNISFSVTDADGDTVTRDTESLVSPIDLSRPMNLDRFDSMEQGYYNLKDWDTNSSLDQAADFIVGNPGNTLLYGKGGNDVLIGDGEADAAVAAINTALGTEISFVGNIAPGASQTGPNADAVDALRNALSGLDEEGIKAFEDAIEKGAGKGDDAIFGGLGNDILMGGAGDDYIDGNGKIKSGTAEDSDIILAGSGNDIIAFDANDILVSGGSGTDVLLAGSNCESSLAGILAGETDARVHGIEVLIRSTKTTHIENFGITSQDALEDLGIYIRDDGMSLDVGMWKQIEDTDGNATFINLKGTLEIQTTLKNVSLVEGKPEITDENGDPVDIPVGGDIPDTPPPMGGEEEALIRAVLESQ